MPRDGSGNFTKLPPDDVISGTTIESAGYNLFTNDVEFDLNWPRPISTGGTGATNAHDAMIALGGEIAKQHVVNFSSHVWANGSFWSDTAATGGPVDLHNFIGSYYEHTADNYAIIHAYDLNDGFKEYTRNKVSGVWEPLWKTGAGTQADTDARYVNVTGDTMSGNLTAPGVFINGTYADLNFYKPSGGTQNWLIRGGDPTTGDFEIHRYALSDGAYLGFALNINRTNANATFAAGMTVNGTLLASAGLSTNGALSVTGGATVGSLTTSGNISSSSSIAAAANINANNFTGGTISISGACTAVGDVRGGALVSSGGAMYMSGWAGNPNNGVIYMNAANTQYINNVNNNFSFTGAISCTTLNANTGANITGNVGVNGNVTAQGVSGYAYYVSGSATTLNAIVGTPSGGAPTLGYNFIHAPGSYFAHHLSMTGGNTEYQFRHSGETWKLGSGSTAWQVTSDIRVKTVKEDYTSGLDVIAALRPVRYVYKGNVSFTAPSAEAKPAPSEAQIALSEKAAAQEFVGLVAQEAEGVLPDCFHSGQGYIDGKEVQDLRSAEYTPLIFALVNAVKELKAKVEALEAQR